MEKEVKQKSNKTVIIILIVVIIILLSLVGYLLYDKFTPKQDVKDEVKENVKKDEKVVEEEFVYPEKDKDYTFIKMNEQKVNFGSKDHKLITYYYSSKETKQFDGPSMEYDVLRKEVYLDSKKIVEIHVISNSTEESINKDIETDEKNTKIEYISDSKNNKKYILLTDGIYPYLEQFTLNESVLFNEKGEEMYSFLLRFTNTDFSMESKNINVGTEEYKEHNYDDSLHKTIYAGKDYLYYLDIENCYGQTDYSDNYYVDEYMMKITDGQLSKKKVASYDKTKVTGVGAMPNCKK